MYFEDIQEAMKNRDQAWLTNAMKMAILKLGIEETEVIVGLAFAACDDELQAWWESAHKPG